MKRGNQNTVHSKPERLNDEGEGDRNGKRNTKEIAYGRSGGTDRVG